MDQGPNQRPGVFVRYSAPVIALLYCAAGVAWILLSDRAVESWFGDDARSHLFQTIKGIGYIVASTVLLWALMQRAIDHIEQARRRAAESEARFRLMADNVADVFWLIDYQSRQLIYLSPAFGPMWGRDVDGRIPTPEEFAAWIHPDDRDSVFEAMQRYIENPGLQGDLEYRVVLPDGSVRWFEDRPRPVADHDGRPRYLTGVIRDVTRQKEAEQAAIDAADTERRLLQELDHRVRNALAGLLSMVELSRRTYTDVGLFSAAVARRVRCMSDVNQLLSESRWSSLDLKHLIATIMPPEFHHRIRIDGPETRIPPRQATAMAMILQEFASNALKHGPVAESGGEIHVAWSLSREGPTDAQVLRLSWRELPCSGPEITAEPGLGTQLIEGFARSELRGQVKLGFFTAGVHHELTVALDGPDVEQGLAPAPHSA